jgi:tRNA threonylcarbamoyladenosine biosynthesis protein TsaB
LIDAEAARQDRARQPKISRVTLLALDSATSSCSLALWRADAIIARRRMPVGGQQDGLPIEVQALLAAGGVAMRDLSRLAVTVGPGRFTGLRAGLAFMRGLALALDLPLVGVTTLEAIAAGGDRTADEVRVAVVDSRRAELFFQVFDAGGGALTEPFAARPEDLAARLPRATRAVADALAAAGIVARAQERLLDAADVARIAATRAAGAAAPAPLYIHPPATTAPRRPAATPE